MEQALVFASVVIGVAVAMEIENLNRLLRSPRVKWHWAQPLFALLVVFLIMRFWWTLANDPQGSITLGAFLPVMWSMVLLALLAAVALPDRIGDDGVDLAAYYQANRRYMWLLVLLMGLPLQGQWLYSVWQDSPSFGAFLERTVADNVAWLVIVALIFARRWWLVALLMAVVSLGPIAWLSRTLG